MKARNEKLNQVCINLGGIKATRFQNIELIKHSVEEIIKQLPKKTGETT